MSPIPPWFTTWLRSGDVGTSSMTIGFVLLGAKGLLRDTDAPYDTSDVGRCIRLLDLAAKHGCDWRGRLGEVADAYPAWAPLVARWGDIAAAYHEDKKLQDAEREKLGAFTARQRKQWLRAHDGGAPSRCWWLVSTLRGNGDPYDRHDPHPFAPQPQQGPTP